MRIKPLFFGGGQQNGIRVGTENVPLASAFYAAAEELAKNRKEHYALYEMLKSRLLERVGEIPEVSVNSKDSSVPYIVNLSVAKRCV